MADRIKRTFLVNRGTIELEYVFETYSVVFMENVFTKGSNYWKLQKYLKSVFINGYPDRTGKSSVSELPIIFTKKQKAKHPITDLLQKSNYEGKGKNQHPIAQKYLLDNDNATFAVEIPVWNDSLHGFIDVIRCVGNDKVEIFDFKPNAHKETKAASQVYRYSDLLSKSTGIPLTDIITSYGDHTNYFITNL